jgi:hypothetical protein
MCNLRGDIHVFLFDYFHVSQIKVQTFLLARKIIRNSDIFRDMEDMEELSYLPTVRSSRSFCYSTHLHSSHRIHPATHHRTRITVHQFLTTNSSKGFYINKKKPTICDLPQNQKQPMQELVLTENPQTSTHRHTFEPTILRTTEIYRRQNIYL